MTSIGFPELIVLAVVGVILLLPIAAIAYFLLRGKSPEQAPHSDTETRLAELHHQFSNQLISPEEYEREKQKIINRP
ncbi:MAG: hypothetical protein V4733_08120 [Verrucomicrobiota bacterium]